MSCRLTEILRSSRLFLLFLFNLDVIHIPPFLIALQTPRLLSLQFRVHYHKLPVTFLAHRTRANTVIFDELQSFPGEDRV